MMCTGLELATLKMANIEIFNEYQSLRQDIEGQDKLKKQQFESLQSQGNSRAPSNILADSNLLKLEESFHQSSVSEGSESEGWEDFDVLEVDEEVSVNQLKLFESASNHLKQKNARHQQP